MTDGGGIPLGTVAAGANRHDAPLLGPTLDTLDRLGRHDRPGRHQGHSCPVQATRRWPVERTHAWGNQFKKLAYNTERCGRVIDALLALPTRSSRCAGCSAKRGRCRAGTPAQSGVPEPTDTIRAPAGAGERPDTMCRNESLINLSYREVDSFRSPVA